MGSLFLCQKIPVEKAYQFRALLFDSLYAILYLQLGKTN